MLEWWQWVFAFVAALLVGLSKTGVAGLSVLSIAIYSSVLPPRLSIGAVLISLLGGDLIAVPSYFADVQWRYLGRLMMWAAPGIAIGAFALGKIDDTNIRRVIGAILVLLVLINYGRQIALAKRQSGTGIDALIDEPTDEPIVMRYPWLGRLAGLAAGFCTMIANASGPIMILYLISLKLPKRQFIGTSAVFYLSLNLFKLPFSYSLGFINPTSLYVSLWLIPFTMLGALIGRSLIHRINQKVFEQSALILTLIAGIRLLF